MKKNTIFKSRNRFTMTMIFTLCIMFMFSSCKKEGKIHLTDKNETFLTNKVDLLKIIDKKTSNNNLENNDLQKNPIYIENITSLNIAIPENLSLQDYEQFIIQNINSINGTLTLKIDGIVFYSSTITNGVETISPITLPPAGSSYPCSVNGIIKCASDNMHKKSVISKLLCSFPPNQLMCYLEEVANCVADYCPNGASPIDVEILPQGNAGSGSLTFLPDRMAAFCDFTEDNNGNYDTKFYSQTELESLTLLKFNSDPTIKVHYDQNWKLFNLANHLVGDGYYSINCGAPYQEFIFVENGIPKKVYKKTF